MFPNKNTTSLVLVICLLGAWFIAGCVTQKKATVVLAKPTCEEALSGRLRILSDSEVGDLLDKALREDRIDGCWIPLMEISLTENRGIPRKHLVKAVKVFNKHSYEALFHMAVHRYFADIAKGASRYREEDRKLLGAYCSYLINSVVSAEDQNLKQAKLLCRKIDRDLYARLFE